jgi:hypothetical protein
VQSTLHLNLFENGSKSSNGQRCVGKKKQGTDRQLKEAIMKTSIVFRSISRSSVLVKRLFAMFSWEMIVPLEGLSIVHSDAIGVLRDSRR